MSHYETNEGIVWREKDGLCIVLSTVSGHYFTFNKTGTLLWRGLIAEKKSISSVIGTIADHFPSAPPITEIEQQCRQLVEEWISESLVRMVRPA
jgi:hypothetical protein